MINRDNKDDNYKNNIYIKYLPKEIILYNLWKYAKPTHYMYYCKELIPKLSIEQTKIDIKQMMKEFNIIYLTSYYGKYLFVDLSSDYLDVSYYNIYNGRGLAEKIINRIKKEELNKGILRFYTLF